MNFYIICLIEAITASEGSTLTVSTHCAYLFDHLWTHETTYCINFTHLMRFSPHFIIGYLLPWHFCTLKSLSSYALYNWLDFHYEQPNILYILFSQWFYCLYTVTSQSFVNDKRKAYWILPTKTRMLACEFCWDCQ